MACLSCLTAWIRPEGAFTPPAKRRRLGASTFALQHGTDGSASGPIRVAIGRRMPTSATSNEARPVASTSASSSTLSSSLGQRAVEQASSSNAWASPGKARGKGGNATVVREDMTVAKHTTRGAIQQAPASGRPENREETMANYPSHTVSVHLPAPKADPRALGCHRS